MADTERKLLPYGPGFEFMDCLAEECPCLGVDAISADVFENLSFYVKSFLVF